MPQNVPTVGMRRFTRLTNAFSKSFQNHCHAVSLHMFHYNLIRIHQTTRMTPAMAAGVTDHLWTMLDLAALIEARESLREEGWQVYPQIEPLPADSEY